MSIKLEMNAIISIKGSMIAFNLKQNDKCGNHEFKFAFVKC